MLTIFGIELPWSSSMLELEYESMLAPYHIQHPANIQRAKYKKFETLKTYLLDFPVVQHLIPYLEQVYMLEYSETPNYTELGKKIYKI